MTHQPQLTELPYQRPSGSSFTPRPAFTSKAPALALCLRWTLGISLLIPLLAPAAGAQTVIDGLPPPPSIPDLEAPPAAAEGPARSPEEPSPEEPSPEQATPAAPADSTQRYRVLINGDSPFLLEQVRRVEPAAAFERHQGQSVIVAGQFSQLAPAQQQVEILAGQGIGAEIAIAPDAAATDAAVPDAETTDAEPTEESDVADEVAVAPAADRVAPAVETADEFDQLGSSIGSGAAALPPAELSAPLNPQPTITDPALAPQPALSAPASAPQPIPSSSPVAQQPTSEPAGSDYYIVVPGEADTLDQLQGRVSLLGANPNAIAQRDRPLGPHLLIGPFVDRQSATRWNQFLRDFGMDARVYYRR